MCSNWSCTHGAAGEVGVRWQEEDGAFLIMRSMIPGILEWTDGRGRCATDYRPVCGIRYRWVNGICKAGLLSVSRYFLACIYRQNFEKEKNVVDPPSVVSTVYVQLPRCSPSQPLRLSHNILESAALTVDIPGNGASKHQSQ